MKARKLPISDYKCKENRWNDYYRKFDMDAYLKTLNYDDTTRFLDLATDGVPKNCRILDVGCGAGRHIFHLAERGFTNVFGVDLSIQALINIRARNSATKILAADACRLPFPEGSFDMVIMVGVVYEIQDNLKHIKLFCEINRILRPGGLFLFINNSPYHFGELLFTVTQFISGLRKRAVKKFFVWRYGRKDVYRLLNLSRFQLIHEWPGNIRQGVFRFFYGLFVKRQVIRNRNKMIRNRITNPYSLHEHYLVQRHPELLNSVGRAVARVIEKTFPFLLANTVGYCARKANDIP